MKKLTLTIGIPAHNEEKNISRLLNSIMWQNKKNYTLEKVIVVCDGCDDKTAEEARKVSGEFPVIEIVEDDKRLGKITRLNSLYKMSESDIYMTIDADMVLGDKKVLDTMIEAFEETSTGPNSIRAGIVGGCSLPLFPENKFEKIINTWSEFWYVTKKDINNGDNVHNHPGCISAMRKELYKQVEIPKEIFSDDDFLYFNAKKLGFKFKYAEDAKVYYRSSNTFEDFLNQHTRFLSLKKRVAKFYGKDIYSQYIVPRDTKLKALAIMLMREPYYMTLAIGLQIVLRGYMKFYKEEYKNGFWKHIKSSKNLGIEGVI